MVRDANRQTGGTQETKSKRSIFNKSTKQGVQRLTPKTLEVHTKQGLKKLDDTPQTVILINKCKTFLTNFIQTWKPKQTKVVLYSSLVLGLVFTANQTFITRAESPGGTKTQDATQVAKGVFITENLGQSVALLVSETKEPVELEDTDFKLATDETGSQTQTLEHKQDVKTTDKETTEADNKEAEKPKEDKPKEDKPKEPQVALLEVQVNEVPITETSKTILKPGTEVKPVQLGSIALPKKQQPKLDLTAEATPSAPDVKEVQEEVKEEPLTISVTSEEQGLLYLKDPTTTYYKDIDQLNKGSLMLGAVLDSYELPEAVKTEYLQTNKRITVGTEDLYYFVTQTGVRGYIPAAAVEFASKPTVEEVHSVKDRDFINFDTEGIVVTNSNPFDTLETTNYTIKKDTLVPVDSTLEVKVPHKLQRFVVAKTVEGATVVIPETDVTITDDQITAPDNKVAGYTDTSMKTKVDLYTPNLTYTGTETKQTGEGVLTFYKFQLEDQEGFYYASSDIVNKQHYGYASNVEKDDRIYKVNISTEVYNEPKSYKNAKVVDKITIGRYVKAANKLKVTNTDDTTTDWMEIYDNGKKLGVVEAGKLAEMAKELTVTAEATDTFKKLAETYQMTEDKLKQYNPEIAIFGDVNKDDTVYLYARENLENIGKKYTGLDGLFEVLDLKDNKVKREMLEAKEKTLESKSDLVQDLGYMIPYIKHRGFLPSVTFAQAIHESGDGSSGLATKDKNLFGIKGSYKGSGSNWATGEVYSGKAVTINATFRSYPTWEESIKDYLDLLENNYNVKGIDDPRQALTAVQAGGYATDPAYISSSMTTISSYDLGKLDN